MAMTGTAKVCVEFDAGNGSSPDEVRFYTATIGDGVSLSYNVQHNLGTSDVLYSLRNISTGELDGFDVVVNASNPNQLTLTFAAPPSANNVRIHILAAVAA